MTGNIDSFAGQLLTWFAGHGRHDLPWQLDRDPYRIWVSEIMLQQTQVATVIPYFVAFMDRFPTVDALADAPLDDVLAHWSGLGYYARARNLHSAAAALRDSHDGRIPASLEALMALPGIGRSTAAAILALAWNEPQAILDGNVKRVLARYHAVRGWTGKAGVLKSLWSLAEQHTPGGRAADYTQAIMDLGATVCTRAKPLCGRCPVAADCRALAEGIVSELPTPRPKRARQRCTVAVALIHTDDGELLLERRPPAGIWGGLLSLPEIPGMTIEDRREPSSQGSAPADADALSPDHGRAVEWSRETFAVRVTESSNLEPVEHSFTHFDLTLRPIAMRVGARAAGQVDQAATVLDADRWLWYNTAQPLPGGMAAPIGKLIRAFLPSDQSDKDLPQQPEESQRGTPAASQRAGCAGSETSIEGEEAA